MYLRYFNTFPSFNLVSSQDYCFPLPFCNISESFFDTCFLPESLLKSVILYPNTAFQLNEYLDRQTTSEMHCRTHCACCAPQRHLAGYDIPLCQLPSFMEKDAVALGRAAVSTWSSLSENEDTSQSLHAA